jgi:hypothetical protein
VKILLDTSAYSALMRGHAEAVGGLAWTRLSTTT